MANTTYTYNPDPDICPACGGRYEGFSRRTYRMLNHMINKGEITVGEARAEAASGCLMDDERELLIGWALDRADQGDDWRAGDDVRLPDGRTVPYNAEDPGWARPAIGAEFPAGSYTNGL